MRSKRDLNVFRVPCSVFGSRFTHHALRLLILLPLLVGCSALANGRDRRTVDLAEPTPIPTGLARCSTPWLRRRMLCWWRRHLPARTGCDPAIFYD
jgi:hypothetical protein